jgi:hypothetical protein
MPPRTLVHLLPLEPLRSRAAAEDNAEILRDHYQEVFNRHAEVDLSVLDEIPQHPMQEHLGKPPSYK